MEEDVKKEVEEKINEIISQGIREDNLKELGELIDIHKDLENEKYWKEKLNMRRMYNGNYGNDYPMEYGARRRDSRGRYMERGGRYQGDDMLEEMKEHYGTYMEARNYGGQETDKAFDYMLKSLEEFAMHLFEESDSPDKDEKIRRTARKISEMR